MAAMNNDVVHIFQNFRQPKVQGFWDRRFFSTRMGLRVFYWDMLLGMVDISRVILYDCIIKYVYIYILILIYLYRY